MKKCHHRSEKMLTDGRGFCRHPSVTGPHAKSTPIHLEQCEICQFRDSRIRGLGDVVETVLSAVGITKQRVSKVNGSDCGCGKRQKKLNEIVPL